MGEYEMADFAYALEEIQPLVAVAIAPFAFKEPGSISLLWDQVIIVDAALYGSILNRRWEMFVWGPTGVDFMHFDVLHQQKRVPSGGYCESCFNVQPDAEGLMRIVPYDSMGGLTMTVRTAAETRYSASTHIPHLTINELWAGTTLWPLKRNGEEVDSVGNILILGGHRQWGRLRPSNTPALVGAMFRIGPVEIWKRVMYGTLTSVMGRGKHKKNSEIPNPRKRLRGKKGARKDWI